MMMQMKQDPTRYKTLVDLSRMLLIFENEAGERGVNEIARSLDILPSKASRMLKAMEVEGLAERNPKTRKYRPGARFVTLGLQYLFTHPVRRIILPHVEQISKELGMYVSWGVFAQGRVIIVDRATVAAGHTPHLIGSNLPLHSSSFGKLFLAYLPEDKERQVLQSIDYERFTPRTLTTLAALRNELAATLARGYAHDKEESRTGEEALAFPIFDESRSVCAALTVLYAVPKSIDREKIISYLKEKATFISRQLGYSEVRA